MQRIKKISVSLFIFLIPLFIMAQEKPKVYVVSNAHLDTQWNWDIQATISDHILNTLNQNLFLLRQYPDYIFNFEGGVKYAWMKEYYPGLYEEVKKYVKEGRWHISGSTWDATDTNIPSPESFTRNILYGQMFYQDEFNVRGTDIFLPDCFGFGWTLPTIAAHSDLIGFSTQKLRWRTNPFFGESKIPFEIGLWQGIDGSRIMLVPNGRNYVTKWADEDLTKNKDLIREVNSSQFKTLYHYYGTGDTGGSPGIESVRAVEKSLKGDGPIRIISATSDQLYKDYLPYDKHPELPVYDGELLMDIHGTGCYTSQAAMKLYNRKNELLADAAERTAVMADWLGGQSYPQEILTNAWRRFIWHQFHDDLPGTSLLRAYEFSWNDELLSQKQFAQVLTASAGSIAAALNTNVKGMPLIVQNTHSHHVRDMIEITINQPKTPQDITIYNENGKKVPVQFAGYKDNRAKYILVADMQPASFAVYDIRTGKQEKSAVLKTGARSIENSIYKVTLNANGDINSIVDKRFGRELVKSGKTIRLALFTENESITWPAWEISKKTIDSTPVDITGDVKISVAENGPVRASLCVERKYGESIFKQYIRLTNGAQDDRIDILSEIDWQTTNALLKAEFPLDIDNEEASYDLGIGHIKRKNNVANAYEVVAQYWADLTGKDQSYGVSIMNDSKSGWDKPDNNTLRLTLLNTPKTLKRYTYQSQQDFGYHTFVYSIMAHKGGITEGETVTKAENLNQPLKAYIADKHQGNLGRQFSFLSSGNSQIVVKALKKAEKSDDYVVRVYETAGRDARNFELSFAADILEAFELNGVEDVIGKVRIEKNKMIASATPFAMKTFRVKLKPPVTKTKSIKSTPIALDYNTKTATYNSFSLDVSIDGKGNSFASELLPGKLLVDGIDFNLGDPALNNAVRCHGDTIILPQNGQYNKLCLLAASVYDDQMAVFRIGNRPVELYIPYYSGFIGQWGHTGHTEGYLKPANIAYVGTHKHSKYGNKDLPYEFTYMFKYEIDIPANVNKLILPDNGKIILFAVSLGLNETGNVRPANNLITSALRQDELSMKFSKRENLLKGKPIISKSGQENNRWGGRATFINDDNLDTRWLDLTTDGPKYIEIDMEKENTIKGWFVYQGGMEPEMPKSLLAQAYQLEIRRNSDEAWQVVDQVVDNMADETNRLLPKAVTARYVRLTVTKSGYDGNAAQIAEFEVY